MQDSLDDYIKIIRNVKSEEPMKLKKDVHLTAQRKKDCDSRAMKIIEFSIEGKLRPEIFTRCLPYISQSHYQDIVEERAITKLCGYSICGKRIADMPKKQYYISTKNNKVYDITDRKNYCSNFCYKASLHIKRQINDSPLWLRKLDDIPEYQLLELSEGGLPGEYIDQGLAKPVVEPTFTPVSIFTHVSLKDMIETEKNKENRKDKITREGKKVSKFLKTTMQTIKENVEHTEEEEMCEVKVARTNNKKQSQQKKHDLSSLTLPVIEEKEERSDSKLEETDDSVKGNSETISKIKKSKRKSSKLFKSDLETLIKKVLKEWLTLESYIFLYGVSKVKEILNEEKLSYYFDKLNIADSQRDQQVKYMDICRKLQLEEMADEKFDNALLGNTKLKPVPDYKRLKEKNKDLNIKVKCFYSGMLLEKEDTNCPTKINVTNKCSTEDSPTVLPLVDVNSQNEMRRKIFLTSINKSMQQLLQALRVPSITSVLLNLQNFIKTFKLKADNIVFKPLMWNYLSVVLLNILSIQDQNIKHILEERFSQEYINLEMSSLPHKNELISDIMTNIQDIEMFVKNYITSK